MTPRMRSIVIGCVLLAALAARGAEPVQAKHARLELLSDGSVRTASHEFWLGVHFSLEKDWHIYWVNPGDSGQPPVLKWELPSGFAAGEIQWPLPEKLKRAALADYGYQDDVVLLVPLRVPRGWNANAKAEIGVQVKWLICREICLADHADLHLAMPISSTAGQDQSQSSLIEAARKRLPRPWPHAWKASAVAEKENFVLSMNAGKPIPIAEFYPLVAEQIENAAAQPLHTTALGAKITLKKSDQLLKPITVLKGVLVLGNGESYQMQAPVVSRK